jgi:transcriptional antiterminator RfaH
MRASFDYRRFLSGLRWRDFLQEGAGEMLSLTDAESDAEKRSWAVIATHANRERTAIEHLERQNFEVYCPQLRKRVRHARKSQDVLRPFFPGYLFVKLAGGEASWRPIRSTFGVRSLITCGARPGLISDAFIEGLKAREIDGAVARPDRSYSIGEHVRICGGPFDGLIGTIIDMDERQRLTILMDLLSGQVKVSIDTHVSTTV